MQERIEDSQLHSYKLKQKGAIMDKMKGVVFNPGWLYGFGQLVKGQQVTIIYNLIVGLGQFYGVTNGEGVTIYYDRVTLDEFMTITNL